MAWAVATPQTVIESHNISSVTQLSPGEIKFTFSGAMKHTRYVVVASWDPDSDQVATFSTRAIPRLLYVRNADKTVSDFTVRHGWQTSTSCGPLSPRFITVVVFGGN